MDDEAFELYNTFSSKRLDEANKIGKTNLAATGKDLMEDEKQGDVAIDLFSAIDLESEAVTERASELEYNQTLCLLTGFLSVNDWYHAHILFDRLSPLNPFVTNYSGSLKSLSPQHMNLSGKLIFRTWCCLQQLLVIQWKQIHLYRDFSLTFRKSFLRCFHVLDLIVTVIHCCCRICSDGSSDPESGSRVNEIPCLHLKEAKFRIEEALGTCLLPSLQLIPANPVVGQEIWEVMNLLPYEARYRLYGEWEKDESVFQWFWLQGKLQSSFNS